MNEGKKPAFADMIVVGFAIFAIFFGAGNLIFPPYLGYMSGTKWFVGFFCFVLADAGLAIMTILAMIKTDGTIWSLLGRMGRKPALLLATAAMLLVGPMICIPRTAATTFEMGIMPLLPNVNSWVFAIIFFAIVYVLTVRPSGVVDVIGKFLTPAMLVVLAILFIKGIVTPIGTIGEQWEGINVAKEGFLAGYQTMDVLGAFAITLVVMKSVVQKGYSTIESQRKVINGACLVALAGLFIVYCGLTYLGATTSLIDIGDVNQAGLVVLVTEILLQRFGVVLLSLIVTFACLTTAIGLTSSAAEYFSDVSHGKLKYSTLVGVICVFGAVISNAGITEIIKIATPILNIIYPILLTQIFLFFFGDKIKNDNVFKGAAIGALIVCIISVAGDFGANVDFITKLPLASIGFNWLVPAAICGIIGGFVPDKKRKLDK